MAPSPKDQRRYRPWLELLEDRLTPSTVNWTAYSGSWIDATNWTDDMGMHRLPTAADDAVIDVGGVAVTHSVGSDTVHSLTLSDNAHANLVFSGGSLTLESGSAVGSTDGFILSGGTVNGTGTLTVSSGGTLTWTSGTMSGTTEVASGGSLQISGTSTKFLSGGTLSNAGTVNRSGSGSLVLQTGGTINNMAGGLFNFLDDSGITNNGGTSFSNAGTVRKSGGTLTSTIAVAFHGLDGEVLDAQSGTLGLGGGGSFSGGTAVTATAGTAALTAGMFTASDGASLGSAGALSVTGGSLTVNAGDNASAQNLLLAGGALAGLGTLEVPSGGTLRWTSGLMSETGTTAVDMGGSLQISGGNKLMERRRLENAGTLSWSGATLSTERGARISNLAGGVVDFLDDSGVTFSGIEPLPSFINAGTVRKSGGAGTTTIGIAFDSSGAVEVHSGTLSIGPSVAQVSGNTLTDGTWYVGANSTLVLPGIITTNQANVTLDGAGSQFAAVNNLASNAGSFSLLGGRNFTTAGDWSNTGSLTVAANSTLTVNGNFTQAAAGALNVQLGGTATGQFSQVVVSGLATLGGTLNVTEVGGFTPAAGDTYQVMSFGSSSGDFATKNGFQLGNGLFFRENLHATDLTLEAFRAQLVFQQQPTDTTAGQSISPAVTVAIVDPATGTPIAFDNTDTVSLSRSGGGALGGTLTQTVSGGVATFADLSITQAGTGSRLNADSTGLATATSSSFAINPAAADHLLFSQQPTDTPAGQTISQVIVQVVDQFGNVVTSDNSDVVTLTLTDNPMTGAMLSGTLTMTVANGVATFSDLSIDLAGSGYTLHATNGGSLPDIDSNTFNIT
jgi:hypothetical protein